jgi:tRNA/tmRNA/rRNA uracil-C5-methylase (TrmA/RlmC/RlmD family)
VSAHSFFQVNTSLIETLVDQVGDRVAPRGGETVLDPTCGVGLFARFLAPVVERVDMFPHTTHIECVAHFET